MAGEACAVLELLILCPGPCKSRWRECTPRSISGVLSEVMPWHPAPTGWAHGVLQLNLLLEKTGGQLQAVSHYNPRFFQEEEEEINIWFFCQVPQFIK